METGFKYGKHQVRVVWRCSSLVHKGRTYELDEVETAPGVLYFAIRLYNNQHHFIKQFLIEPELLRPLAEMLLQVSAARDKRPR